MLEAACCGGNRFYINNLVKSLNKQVDNNEKKQDPKRSEEQHV